MAEHTPGPLQAEHDEEALASYVLANDKTMLAQVSWTIIGGRSRAEQESNATLFAAAPDLLEACKKTLRALNEELCPGFCVHRVGTPCEHATCPHAILSAMLRATIKKAEHTG